MTGFRLASIGLLCTAALAAAPAMAAGDPVKGKTVFARCSVCHTTAPGKNLMGPSLAGVVGRKSATMAGFTYSAAMQKYGKSWDAATLDAFLTAPMKSVPGTRMVFAGIPKAQDRADLIAYLKKPVK